MRLVMAQRCQAILVALVGSVLAAGCAARASASPGGASSGVEMAESGSGEADASMRLAMDAPPMPSAVVPAGAQARYAQVGGTTPPQGGTAPPLPPAASPTAAAGDDAKKPLLVYTAELTMAVFEVEKVQEGIIAIAHEVGGYLAHRSGHVVVVRVPASKFQLAVDRMEEAGDVLGRDVRAQDVTEQFRDIEIRLRNAEVMRSRLEKLLERANTVEEALRIEQELQRLTETIETLKGKLRLLRDQLAFSTITIRFQPKATEGVTPDTFRLPFEWLDRLGLSNLLRLK
jgi:hypothetical protein